MPGPGIKLEAGHVLDERYLLENVIGEGGMGTVFAARHLELGDTVAVKVLQSDQAVTTMPEENLERFLREARLASKIKNDHVVRVLDVARGKHGAPPYIVMELLDGIDLGDLLQSLGRVRMPEAIDYVLQACEALAEAHALGIVHRDLKSSNLHVSQRGDGTPLVKVLDFGISKAHDDGVDQNLTATSAVFGSPAYMSPEQIRSAKHVDARTDVWALNVVLYELLSGQLPFNGDSASAMLAAISADPYTPLRKYVPEAPEGLERAIHSAFVKDREKRTPSIAAYAESIAPFGGPNVTQSLSAIQRAAQRISTRSHGAQAIVGLSQSGSVGVVGNSDTMRVSSSITTGEQEADTEPLPKVVDPPTVPAAASSARAGRSDDVLRTDREMIVPTQKPAGTSMLAIAAVALALSVGLGVIALVFYVKSQPHKQGEFPPPPVVVTVTVTTPAPAPPPPPPPPPKPGSSVEPVVSIELPATNPTARKIQRPAPHPAAHGSAPPKSNHGPPDTSQRE